MQLTTITLATILISSVATAGSDTSTFASRQAMFQKLTSESEARKEAGSGSTASALRPAKKPTVASRTPPSSPPSLPTVSPVSTPAKLPAPRATTDPLKSGSGGKPKDLRFAGLQKQWESASASESTPASKPVRTPLSSSAKTTGTRAMPTGPAKGSTATSRTGPIPSSKVSPAPGPTASKPVTGSSRSAQILLPPSGTPSGPPQFYREKGLGVTGLPSKFEPTPLPSQPASRTSSTPPVPPSAGSIPEDTDFMSFKGAIEQRKYLEAMEIVTKLSGKESLEPYGNYLADLKVDEIIKMVNGFEEAFLTEPLPEGEHEYILKSPYSKPTLGLFLMHANDKKFRMLLDRFVPRNQLGALMFSIKYGAGSSLESFIRVFEEISRIDMSQLSFALEAAAECIFGYNKPEFFNQLVTDLQKQSILDKDLVNFAYNAAFVEACRHDNLILAAIYWDLKDTEIFPWMYARAMRLSYDKTRSDNSVFRWLVGYASGSDLHIFLLENKGKGYYGEEILKLVEDLYSGVRYKPRAQRYMSF